MVQSKESKYFCCHAEIPSSLPFDRSFYSPEAESPFLNISLREVFLQLPWRSYWLNEALPTILELGRWYLEMFTKLSRLLQVPRLPELTAHIITYAVLFTGCLPWIWMRTTNSTEILTEREGKESKKGSVKKSLDNVSKHSKISG